MPDIHINESVAFSPNWGVQIDESILKYTNEEIREMLSLAYAHCQDELLVEANCGGTGPFADYGDLTFDEYLLLKDQFEKERRIEEATKSAKKTHSKKRRTEFSSQRSLLVLQMIEAGVPYVCAHEGCDIAEILTIDHVAPLSKGGTDELKNLQFLCRSHNSAKGDRVVT